MDNGVLLETLVEFIRHYIRDQVRVFSVFLPASDIRSSKISRHFHCCCFENTNRLWFVYKTKITLEIKRKHLKDILEISKIYSSFMFALYNLKNIALIYTGLWRAYLHDVFACIFVI